MINNSTLLKKTEGNQKNHWFVFIPSLMFFSHHVHCSHSFFSSHMLAYVIAVIPFLLHLNIHDLQITIWWSSSANTLSFINHSFGSISFFFPGRFCHKWQINSISFLFRQFHAYFTQKWILRCGVFLLSNDLGFNLIFGSHFSSRRVSLRYVPGQQNVRRILQSPRDRQAVNEEHEPKTHTDLGSVYLKYRERGRREQKKKYWEILW